MENKKVSYMLFFVIAMLLIGGTFKVIKGDKVYSDLLVSPGITASVEKLNQVYNSENNSGTVDLSKWDKSNYKEISSLINNGSLYNEYGRIYEEYPAEKKMSKNDGELLVMNPEGYYYKFPQEFLEVHLESSLEGDYYVNQKGEVYYASSNTK